MIVELPGFRKNHLMRRIEAARYVGAVGTGAGGQADDSLRGFGPTSGQFEYRTEGGWTVHLWNNGGRTFAVSPKGEEWLFLSNNEYIWPEPGSVGNQEDVRAGSMKKGIWIRYEPPKIRRRIEDVLRKAEEREVIAVALNLRMFGDRATSSDE